MHGSSSGRSPSSAPLIRYGRANAGQTAKVLDEVKVAVLPFFVLGPNALLSLIGHIRGPKPVQLPDPDVIRELDVDVVIPAYNERATIALCLASVMRQTIKPNSVTVIDDGSEDDTAAIAEAFAAANNVAVRVIRRRRSIGKTPGVKIESRNLEGDVEFILDADTVLMSEDYIEKVVSQLYRVPGIASACGLVYPLRERDREALSQLDSMQRLREQQPQLNLSPTRSPLKRLAKGIGSFYRDVMYQFIQMFFYAGAQNLLGSSANPVGCAVAYRREYLKELFDLYEPGMGDDMTSSEDIFFGAAFIAHGYHNNQIQTVIARSDEPEIQQIPRQLVKWTSAWLQTAYHLPDMLLSPFRFIKRYRHNRQNAEVAQKRHVVDGYRQPFGMQYSKQLGRPGGWIIFFAIFEKISFTMVLVILLAIGAWWPLAITIAAETLLYTMLLIFFSKGRRLEYAVKGILVTPLRYGMLIVDFITFSRFLFDLAIARRGWRK
jgi:glycosyltransferase involved in cell wall biosynthesis